MQFTDEALKYLNLGISGEIAAYVFYKKAAVILKDMSLKEAVLKIAAEEKTHFLSLEDVYDRNVRSEMWAPYKDILNKPGLPDIDELVQDTHKELLAKIADISSKREVLEMGLSLEKEAVALYSDASAKSSHPDVKKVFEYLIGIEKSHVQMFEKELAAL
ncbi:MAG: ferritin family protein [Deltaproteobacteria bacterium]|nr:ferritin family protein [Deltaproteobacteria bacterium]